MCRVGLQRMPAEAGACYSTVGPIAVFSSAQDRVRPLVAVRSQVAYST